jgi:hypothetical protein
MIAIARMASNINNLNILTFIKDIYQSLKHIDNCFNSYKENIDARLTRVEDNQQTILDKLNILEQMLYKINSNTQQQVSLDKNIENELLEKMNTLNKNTTMDKLNLKPEELTFANILENNYTILDINETLSKQNTISTSDNLLSFSTSSDDGSILPSPLDASTNNLYNEEIIKKKETLENLLF